MNKLKASWVASALVLGLIAPAICLGESLEDVEKQIKEAFAKVKTFSAKVEMTGDMNYGGTKITTHHTGTYETMHGPEGEYMFRNESKGTMNVSGMPPSEQESLIVCDGEFMYQLSNAMGNTSATKSKAMTDPLPWAQIRDDNNLSVLPSEKIDGEDCHAIEAKPKVADASPFARTVFYCRKDIGVIVKQVSFDKDNNAINTVVLSDQKVNSDIPKERFKFEAPAGVTVMDMTGA